MFTSRLCLIIGHSINRKRVWYDGLDFRTKCARCGKPMIRTIDGWREFDAQRDADSRRREHTESH